MSRLEPRRVLRALSVQRNEDGPSHGRADDRDRRGRVHRQPPGGAARRARGERVRVVERPGADATHLPAGVEVVRADIRDRAAVERADGGGGGSTTWRPTRTSGCATAREFDAVNHRGTVHVLDAALAAGAERVLHTSTESILTRARAGRADRRGRRRSTWPTPSGRTAARSSGPRTRRWPAAGPGSRWSWPTRRCRSGRATAGSRRRPG